MEDSIPLTLIVPLLAMFIFVRWIRFMNLITSYEVLGKHVTPLMYSMRVLFHFTIVLAIMTFAYMQAAIAIGAVG